MSEIPSLATFLGLPDAEVAALAPATVGFAPGGTRRQAAMQGLVPERHEYLRWARVQLNACFQVLFDHGVKHVISPLATPTQLNEGGAYGERFLDWLRWGLTGSEPLADYRRHGWQVRLIGTLDGELGEIAADLAAAMPEPTGRTLWWVFTTGYELPWEQLLASGARTRAAAIRALYGADIPPAELLLATGKPALNAAVLPPLLQGNLHCYWLQRPGYVLDRPLFRHILYDYAYLRPTWRTDKTGRAEAALAHRDLWERAPTLGLGRRLGPFWYPDCEPSEPGVF